MLVITVGGNDYRPWKLVYIVSCEKKIYQAKHCSLNPGVGATIE